MTSWIEISGAVKGEAADAIADALMESGALAVDVADLNAESDAEQPIFGEPGMALDQRWADSRIAALFDSDVATDAIEAIWMNLRAQSNAALGPHEFRVVPETDWVRATQAQFEPIEITPALWIVPTWCEPPTPSAINLRVDPGLAFGTGTHPTTRLCLQWLTQQALGGNTVLDYGCGSGILAMAASALGAADVLGVDIDSQAIETSQLNTAANKLTARYEVSSDSTQGAFDVVVANILAGPLTVLAPAIASHVKIGGRLAMAGILAPQVERIIEAYAPWLIVSVAAERDGWVLMTGQRLS
ncbi:MAG: 50S ribosomal protein L11 methyltransferase [Betaproteobacteria bacterium]|nr:MAG: 50S ribosomal protein L11 methyltransferase [Betaproteobacteria bacterium]